MRLMLNLLWLKIEVTNYDFYSAMFYYLITSPRFGVPGNWGFILSRVKFVRLSAITIFILSVHVSSFVFLKGALALSAISKTITTWIEGSGGDRSATTVQVYV